MSPDTRHAINGAGLRVIRALADKGSYSRAAVRLGLSQTAIYRMTHRLEQRVGTPLVERRGHQVRLTEAGRRSAGCWPVTPWAFWPLWPPPSKRWPPSPRHCRSGCRAGTRRGCPCCIQHPRARRVAVVHCTFPGLTLSFREASADVCLETLRAGDCDVVVAYGEGAFGSQNEHSSPLTNVRSSES